MSDTVKLIIEIPEDLYKYLKNISGYTAYRPFEIIAEGIPLDDVKAEIRAEQEKYSHPLEIERAIEILDNIGKPESEG